VADPPIFMHTPFVAELPNLTHGQEACFRGHSRPRLKRAGPLGFQISGVPFYLCVHHFSQNYQIWLGNTCGEGECILGSATLLIQRQLSSRAAQF